MRAFKDQEARNRGRAVQVRGPDRVVVNPQGMAEAPRSGVPYWDVVFIREDGWSLGAPAELEETAERIWNDAWVEVFRDGVFTPYTPR